MNRSRSISLIAVFAALIVVFDIMILPQFSSGVWYGLVFLIEPITGIILGPYKGFLANLIGVMVGHVLSPRGVEEFLFTLGAPVGAMVSGMLFKHDYKKIFIIYTIMLTSFFITPVAWQLPIWGIWDVLLAYLVLLVTSYYATKRTAQYQKATKTSLFLGLSAFIGLEADVLFRICLFIPAQTYQSIYGLPVEALQAIWVAGALITPIKVAFSAFTTALLGSSLIRTLNSFLEV